MYLQEHTKLGKLRAYKEELSELYEYAISHGNLVKAKDIFERRRRVWRTILLYEEWNLDDSSNDLRPYEI